MALSPEQEQLRMGLEKDLADARSRVSESAQARGVREDFSSFEPRAIRMKGKAIGQSELEASKSAINKAVEDLTFQAGLTDMVQQAQFKSNLKGKLNAMRLEAIRSAAEIDKAMLQRKMTIAQKRALIAAYSSALAGAAAMGVASVPGQGSAQTNAEKSMQGAQQQPTTQTGQPVNQGGKTYGQ